MEMDKEELLKLYPPYDSVLGPYERGDGRKHVVLNNSTASKGTKGKTRTISYPKAVVESNIGRRMNPDETIDHEDRDKTNDTVGNYIIRPRAEHAFLDVERVAIAPVTCPQCGTSFQPTQAQANSPKDKAGPFCSRRCTGLYGAAVQNGAETLERTDVDKTYFKLKK